MAIIFKISQLGYTFDWKTLPVAIDITYDEIRELMGKDSKKFSNIKLKDTIDGLYEGLQTTKCKVEDGSKSIQFTLFPTFVNDIGLKKLSVEVHKLFLYLFFGLRGNYSLFDLEDFRTLTSKYDKYLFMLIKKNRGLGKVSLSLEDYKRLLGINQNYDNRKVVSNVLKPAVDRLKAKIPKLNLTTIKDGSEHRLVKVELAFEISREDLEGLGPSKEKEIPASNNLPVPRVEVKKPSKRKDEYGQRIYSDAEIKAIELRKLGVIPREKER